MPIRDMRWSRTLNYAGFLISTLALSVLLGCAAKERIGEPPVVQEPSVAEGFSVSRFDDGREGFSIVEVPRMEEEPRRDFERAVSMLKEGNYEGAVGLLEKVVEMSPGVTAPYIDLAIAYRHIGKVEQAEEHLKTALGLVPDHPVASNEYGLLCRKTGRFNEAREIYEKAITSFPEYFPLHRNLGILCDLYLNDLQCALEHYEIYSESQLEDRQVELWIVDLRARLKNK